MVTIKTRDEYYYDIHTTSMEAGITSYQPVPYEEYLINKLKELL